MSATTIHVPVHVINDHGADLNHPEPCELTVIFTGPDGREFPVTATFFQVRVDGTGSAGFGRYPGDSIGAGLYFRGTDGQKTHGTVMRWDFGPGAEPTVGQWQAPHCARDECGSPCEHVA
jgi:hypothetical protein